MKELYRLSVVRERTDVRYDARKPASNSLAADTLLRPFYAGVDREHFIVLLLDQKNRPIGVHTVAIGSLSAAIVHPREVFKAAILANASGIVLSHNHPSGDASPSGEDIAITKRVREAGDLLGIRVLDHLILGDDECYSFVDHGVF